MQYNQENIIRLIDLAFRRYASEEAFQRKLPISDIYDIGQLQSLLKKPETLSALLILLNGISLSVPASEDREGSLLHTADQYPLSYLHFSSRTANALSHLQKLQTVGDLLRLSDGEISHIRGIGPHSKTMEEIRAARINFIREFQDGLIR